MKIFIVTDLEGASGVCRFSQARELGPEYEEACRLLMGDINACIDGLIDAGADDILVCDGHGIPYNFVPEMMHPGAKHIVGDFTGDPPLGGLGPDFDAVVLVGYHAMAGTPDGVLHHTQSSRTGQRYWYNGRESGEIAQMALLAGHFDIPVIMVTSDEAGCREAKEFLGDEIVTVSVKKGLNREGAVMVAPQVAREMIRQGAKESVARIPRCKPYKIDLPIKGSLAFPDKETADKSKTSKSKRIDDLTFETAFDTALDILKF